MSRFGEQRVTARCGGERSLASLVSGGGDAVGAAAVGDQIPDDLDDLPF